MIAHGMSAKQSIGIKAWTEAQLDNAAERRHMLDHCSQALTVFPRAVEE